eukprot:CAMPEP_0181415760 /NCGR_PEP_ID=MMETSP1110-20121109/10179_1 /TAXON_ID=174948 /ORGANISM="Symbiodinium sp., Strain CCMP421" /LENGTH=239 /DNA_ID=CAMNT_0023538665 /DNA_START=6 /DNA_END=726 /DNA_ORIENTATION=-
MTLVVQCRIPDGWKDSPDAREAALRSVRPEAMAVGEMLLYREASKRALKASGAKPLWIGARASFEKFSATPAPVRRDQQARVFAIAGLCVHKNLAAVVISFLLLTIGVSRGDPHGTRSRNSLGFVCCLSLTVYSCLLFLFEDFALSSIPQVAVVAVPTCYYLHLQLMPADLTQPPRTPTGPRPGEGGHARVPNHSDGGGADDLHGSPGQMEMGGASFSEVALPGLSAEGLAPARSLGND